MRVHVIILFFLLISQHVIAQLHFNTHIKTVVAAELPNIGVAGPVTGILNNQLVVAGGANFPDAMPWKGGAKKYHDRIFIYQPSGSKLTLLKKQANLPVPIAYAAICNTPDGMLYAGGENAEGISNKTWLVQWDKIKQSIVVKAYPDLPIALTNASAVFVNNRVYLVGGETANATSSALYFLDLLNIEKGWQGLCNLPQPLSHLVLTIINKENTSSLYVMGGRQKNPDGISSFSNKTYRYNIKNDSWETMEDMPYALSAGTGVCWNNNQIIIFGGDRGIVFNQVEQLLVAIANETNTEKKQALINQKNQLQEMHPGFSKTILAYAVDSNKWSSIGELTQATPVTTTAFFWNSAVFIPSGEIKAGIRSNKILQINIQPPNRE